MGEASGGDSDRRCHFRVGVFARQLLAEGLGSAVSSQIVGRVGARIDRRTRVRHFRRTLPGVFQVLGRGYLPSRDHCRCRLGGDSTRGVRVFF